MTQAAVATLVHQTLDVHLGFTTQVTFNGVCRVDVLTNRKNFRIAQLIHATGFVDFVLAQISLADVRPIPVM